MNRSDRREFMKHATAVVGGLAAVAIWPEAELARAAQPSAGELSVGIIGAGRQGRAIIGELQKLAGVKITAICDTDQGRLDAGLRRAAGAVGYKSHAELLEKAKDVQAVIIATPTHLHKDIALDAIGSGRHVYCEAPMAHTIEDCRAIAKAAQESRNVFAAGLEARSNPIYKLARTFFKSDAVRDLVAVRAQANQKTSWRTPASDPARERELNWRLDPAISLGLVGEWGVQQIDTVNFYLGKYPTAVRGMGGIRLHADGREVADTIQCEFTLPAPGTTGVGGGAGPVFSYSATLANSYDGKYEVFYGTNAAIKLAWSHGWMFKEADAPTQGWEVYANRQQFHNDEGITLIADATKLASQGKLKEGIGLPESSLYYALADFVRSAVEGKPAACSADDGLKATAIAILANKAIVSGERITIEDSALKVG